MEQFTNSLDKYFLLVLQVVHELGKHLDGHLVKIELSHKMFGFLFAGNFGVLPVACEICDIGLQKMQSFIIFY